jgi:hypothetical protein
VNRAAAAFLPQPDHLPPCVVTAQRAQDPPSCQGLSALQALHKRITSPTRDCREAVCVREMERWPWKVFWVERNLNCCTPPQALRERITTPPRDCREAVQIGYEAWLRGRNVDASKKIFVAIGIVVFDFELLISDRCYEAHTCSPLFVRA